jgi:hypothetical protein
LAYPSPCTDYARSRNRHSRNTQTVNEGEGAVYVSLLYEGKREGCPVRISVAI